MLISIIYIVMRLFFDQFNIIIIIITVNQAIIIRLNTKLVEFKNSNNNKIEAGTYTHTHTLHQS